MGAACRGLSVHTQPDTGRTAKWRRPPQAVQALSADANRIAASDNSTSCCTCRRRKSGKRLNPVMKIPCQSRPYLLPAGRWSGAGQDKGTMAADSCIW